MEQYYILIAPFLLGIAITLLFKKSVTLRYSLEKLSTPSCILDKNGAIIWKNQLFENNFIKLRSKNFASSFEIEQIMDITIAKYAKTKWKIENIILQNEISVIFTPFEDELIKWWEDLPFAIAVLNENNEIESANKHFQSLINLKANSKVHLLAKKINIEEMLAQPGKEIIWQTKAGISPILTWVKHLGRCKLLILENRIEFIKLRNQAQQSQHMQILGQISCNIVHDFNNVLTAISGFTELLESQLPNNDMLKEIRRNTQHAANLAKELLQFVKEKPNEEKTTNPTEFIAIIKPMLQKLLGETIHLNIKAAKSGLVEISETQLEQIILNMTLNGKDAMANGGQMNMLLNKVKFKEVTKITPHSSLAPGEYFVLEISDTGCGIPKDNINKVFAPFFSTKEKGTGLGLASCLQIVQHAGGTINLKTSSKGTSFFIYLPISKQKAEKKPEQTIGVQHAQKPFEKKTLVLAEDEEIVKKLVHKALTQEGYEILSFDNGQDALKALKKHNVDGLITDAVLPGLNGIALAQYASQKNMPILIVSGYGLDDIAQNINFEFNYLAKPFTLKQLKEKVNEVMQ